MFTVQNLQINRGSLTSNAQGKFVTTLHTYRDDTATIAAIQLAFPPFLNQGANQEEIQVGDHMIILGSDTTTFNKILDLDPFTLGPDLFSGASGLSIGPTIPPVDNNAAKITGNILQMEQADVTHSGIVTNLDQTFSGTKSFATGLKTEVIDRVTAGDLFIAPFIATSVTLGADTTVNPPATLFTDNLDSATPTLTIGATNAFTIDFPQAAITHFMQGNTNIDIGPNALNSTTTASANVGIGLNALTATTTGNGNVGVGEGALQSNTTAQFNTAIGAFALADNTTINNLVAVGVGALQANTTGGGNTAVGGGALNDNTTGSLNVAIGDVSLQLNTTGSNNTAVGANSLLLNTTGSSNVAIGANALAAATTAFGNVAIGEIALALNTTSGNNVAIGRNALHANTTVGSLVAVGVSALAANTTGAANTAVGSNSLLSNTTGSFNTALGQATLVNATTGGQNTALGYNALNSVISGSQNVAVANDTLSVLTTGVNNIALGGGSLNSLSTGGTNIGIGIACMDGLTTGARNIAMGGQAGDNYTGAESDNIVFRNVGVTGESGVIRIGIDGTQVKNFQSGIRGVTTDAADAIAVLISSTGQLGTTSSLRAQKENIKTIDANENCEIIKKLNAVRFDYISSKGRHQQFGLIAEEVAEVFEDICAYETVDGKEQLKTIYYDRLPIMLLREVQRLQTEVELLKSK